MDYENNTMKNTIIPITAVCLLLCGCTSVPKVIKALAKDPATVRLRVVGSGINIELDRTAPNSNSPPHTVGNGTISVGEKPESAVSVATPMESGNLTTVAPDGTITVRKNK